MSKGNFISLHNHTELGSPLDGFNDVKDLFVRAKEIGHPGVAITEHGTMTSIYDAYKASQETGVKLIPGCLLAGQEIITSVGVKKIQDVQLGDYVLTHKGRFRKVVTVMEKQFSGKLFEIKLKKTNRTLKLTEEHPILIRNNNGEIEWIEPGDIEFGYKSKSKGNKNWHSYVCFPKTYGDLEFINTEKYLPKTFNIEECYISKQASKINRKYIWTNFGKKIPLTKDFLYFLGLYTAEGSTCHKHGELTGTINLTFNIKESKYISFVKNFIKDFFKIDVRIYERAERGSCEIEFNNLPLAHILKNMFGNGAKNKFIPEEIFNTSIENQKAYIDGLIDGDGRSLRNSFLKTSSESLAWGFKTLLASQGIWASVSTVKTGYDGKTFNHYSVSYTKNSDWRRSIDDENYTYKAIKKISYKNVEEIPVYNIEVEEDNSYVSDFALHNCEAYFAADLENRKSNHMVLLARNEVGYRNLLRLNYEAYRNQVRTFMNNFTPRITWEHIEQFNEGVICLTACANGLLSRTIMAGDEDLAIGHMLRLQSIFQDRFFLELQPHNLKTSDGKVDQMKVNETLVRYSHDYGIPYVITCDAHYRDADHAKYHDFMLAIRDKKPADDPDRFRYSTDQMYLKTDEEILDFFGSEIADVGMANSMKIFDACEEPHYIKPKGPILPKFPVQDEDDYSAFKTWYQESDSSIPEDKAYLRYRCIEGFKEKLTHLSKEDQDEAWERVKTELGVLEARDFSSYMLIVSDAVRWAKDRMPVGPARGCFVPGSRVKKADGSFVEIEKISKGDMVIAHDGSAQTVIDCLTYNINEEIVTVEMENGKRITCTKDHEFFTVDKGWVKASDLSGLEEIVDFE